MEKVYNGDLRASIELIWQKLKDGAKVRQILRILDSKSVSISTKESVLKTFIPKIKKTNMDLYEMLECLSEYT